jgi:hypothetical protein
MERREWRQALIVLSVVLAADQVWKYLAGATPEPAAWGAGRLQAITVGIAAMAMLLVLMAGVARAGLLPAWLAGALSGGGVSIFIDRASIGVARTVFDLGGIGDLATTALLTGAVVWIVRSLRISGDGGAGVPIGQRSA